MTNIQPIGTPLTNTNNSDIDSISSDGQLSVVRSSVAYMKYMISRSDFPMLYWHIEMLEAELLTADCGSETFLCNETKM